MSDNIDTDLADAIDRQSPGGQGVRSSSEWIKSYSSIMLVNFSTFLNFFVHSIILQTVEKDKFNALEISHFLVYVWRREHSLACLK